MKEGGKVLGSMLKEISGYVKPGITSYDLENFAKNLVLSKGGEVKPAFVGVEGYPYFLCTSINSEIVHGIPSKKKLLKEGDIINIDFGIKYKGFCTDSAVTLIITEWAVPRLERQKEYAEKIKLINVTKEALRIGISKAKPENTTGDIGNAIQKYVEGEGFNVVRDLVGHGIGRKLHEYPEVPNFGKPGQGAKLKDGMVIAIEPMVVLGDWKIKEGKDGFSYETADGELAAHFEHTVAITKNGPLVLTE